MPYTQHSNSCNAVMTKHQYHNLVTWMGCNHGLYEAYLYTMVPHAGHELYFIAALIEGVSILKQQQCFLDEQK